MKEIIKKCTSDIFEKVLSGKKNFDLRLANENYNEGDVLILKEIDENRDFTGREIRKEISFVFRTKDLEFWSKEEIDKYGFVVMGLK